MRPDPHLDDSTYSDDGPIVDDSPIVEDSPIVDDSPIVEDSPEMELRCGAIAAGGGCVSRAPDGRVVFVRHALPGELVRAQVTAVTRAFLRADAVEVLEPSPDRVDAPCPHAGAGRCGGCDFQHASLDAQRRMKAELVAEQLRRLAGIDREVTVEELPGAPDGLSWRTRVSYGVDASGRTGLRRHRSHELEVVERCAIAAESVASVGAERLCWTGATAVEVFAPVRDATAARVAAAGRAVVTVTPGHGGLRPSGLPRIPETDVGIVVERQVVRVPGRVATRVLDHDFRITAGAFWQVHRSAPETLCRLLIDGLEPRAGETVLDLFAGVGLFSVVLGTAVGPSGALVAVERDRRACADARFNTRHAASVSVRTDRVTPALVTSLARGLGGVDLVVLDPPREGAGPALVAALVALDPAPRRIAYVACDPASFARDLSVALRAGWRLASFRALDQFPMTEHVEIVAIIEPPSPSAEAESVGPDESVELTGGTDVRTS